MSTLELQVASLYDDAHERRGGTDFSYYINLVHCDDNATSDLAFVAGLRFQNVTISPGAAILTCVASVYIAQTSSDDPNVDIFCEDEDDATSFFSTPDVASRTKTTASATWTDTGLGVGWADSADFAAALQEVIDRPGWASGQSVTVLLEGRGEGASICYFLGYKLGPGNAAKLTITYADAAEAEGDSPGQVPVGAGDASLQIASAGATPGQISVGAGLGYVMDRLAGGAFAGQVPIGTGGATVEIAATGATSGQAPVAAGDAIVAFTVVASGGYGGQVPLGAGDGSVYDRYYVDARGLWRIFAAAVYRFYWSNSGPPAESDTPDETSATLAHTTTATFSGTGTWWISVSWFNGVLDSGFLPVGPHGETYLRLDLDSDVEVGQPPAGPIDWRLQAKASGVVRIWGLMVDESSDRAGEWAIAYTTDGSTPAEDTPDISQEMDSTGIATLEYDLPAQADGTTVKVRLQTRRNDGSDESPDWVYSEDSVVKTLAADGAGPSAPIDLRTWPGPLPAEA